MRTATNAYSDVVASFPGSTYTPLDRKNPRANYAPRTESGLVPSTSGNAVKLDYGIRKRTGFTVHDNTTNEDITSFVRADASPTAGDCAVDWDAGILTFHSSRAGHSITVVYTPSGSVTTADFENQIQAEIVAVENLIPGITGTTSPIFTIASEGDLNPGDYSALRLNAIDYDGYTPGYVEIRAQTDGGLTFMLNDGADSLSPINCGLIAGNGGSITNLNASYIASGNIGYSYMPSGTGTWNCGKITFAQTGSNINSDWIGISRSGSISLSDNISKVCGWRQLPTTVTLNGKTVAEGLGFEIDGPTVGTDRFGVRINAPAGGAGVNQGLCINGNTFGDGHQFHAYDSGYHYYIGGQGTNPTVGSYFKIYGQSGVMNIITNKPLAIFNNNQTEFSGSGRYIKLAYSSGGCSIVARGLTGNYFEIGCTDGNGLKISSPGGTSVQGRLQANTTTPPTAGAYVQTPSIALGVCSKTANYTLTDTDCICLCNATSAAFAITLPTAVGRTGTWFTVKKTDASANAITVTAQTGQTIDGYATISISVQFQNITMISDGANWAVLGVV